LEQLQVVAFTHQFFPLDLIGKLHIEDTEKTAVLNQIKSKLDLTELVYVSTCNRVEFIMCGSKAMDSKQLQALLGFFPLAPRDSQHLTDAVVLFNGDHAVEHLFKVASSLDSMVIGEREIITQLRKSFEEARTTGLSGDTLRLVGQKLIETAKQVYTETHIAKKPVSVVSLAWHGFRRANLAIDTPILLVGAGQTITNLSKFLLKAGYTQITIANRTFSKALQVASQHLNWKSTGLEELSKVETKFEAIFTCTGSQLPVLDNVLYNSICTPHTRVFDLALPSDCSAELIQELQSRYTGMNELKSEAEMNLSERALEVVRCEKIIQDRVDDFRSTYRQRQLEIAMSSIPFTIKQIKEVAVTEVFAKDLETMDAESKVVLENVLAYMEKKYISLPMKMAREVILGNVKSKS
jgi:glutamyl-tRNA reductase